MRAIGTIDPHDFAARRIQDCYDYVNALLRDCDAQVLAGAERDSITLYFSPADYLLQGGESQ